MNERKTLYIFDGSAGDNDHPDVTPLTELLYNAIRKPQIINPEQIETNIAYLVKLKKFSETRALIAIPETIIEQRAHLEILNEQHDLIRKTISSQNNKRISRKQLRHLSRTHREYEPEQEDLEDLEGRLERIRLYAQSLTGFVKQLENKPISTKDLNGNEYAMWEWAYKRATAIHPPAREVKGHKKLGTVLETDVKIVAMTMALSLENPVTIICRDSGVNRTLHRVNDTAGPNWRGRPRYEIKYAPEVDDAIYLEQEKQPKIRLAESAEITEKVI